LDLLTVLKKVVLFEDFDLSTLTAVAQSGCLEKYSNGTIIFEEGSDAKSFFIVVKGSVAINKNVAGGRKRNLSTLGPGEIFGEIALYDDEPRSADAEAVEETEVLRIENNSFLEILKNDVELNTKFQLKVIKVLCKRLRVTSDMLKEGVIWGFNMQA